MSAPDEFDKRLTASAAALTRFGETMAEITVVDRERTAANLEVSARLDEATAAGRLNAWDLVDGLATTYEGLNDRLATRVVFLEDDVALVDATVTMTLDKAEESIGDARAREFLGMVAILGHQTEAFVAEMLGISTSLDVPSGMHERLEAATASRVLLRQRILAACYSMITLGQRARVIGEAD